jgi:hypothetical protein
MIFLCRCTRSRDNQYGQQMHFVCCGGSKYYIVCPACGCEVYSELEINELEGEIFGQKQEFEDARERLLTLPKPAYMGTA